MDAPALVQPRTRY